MKTMAISQFKTHALKIIGRIAKENETMVITKRGKPVAKIMPYEDEDSISTPGQLADTLLFENDIVSPLGEDMWDASS